LFSVDFPTGDRGGNLEAVKGATGEVLLLHSYWDAMFGSHLTPQGAIDEAMKSGLAEVPIDQLKVQIDDPEVWFIESFELAKQFAYTKLVLSNAKPVTLTPDGKPESRSN
jgi:hypothetical protein